MKKTLSTVAALAVLTGSALYAQDFENQLKARQGQFQLLAINLGIIGGMARGNTEYDAETAQAAADTIHAVSMINQAPLWPQGSDASNIDGTRAKAEIWENFEDVSGKWAALGEASVALQAAAGQGLDGLGPALGAFGGTCKDCHDTYRVPE